MLSIPRGLLFVRRCRRRFASSTTGSSTSSSAPSSPTQHYHLAILNVARQRADLTDPIMAEFVDATPTINALARLSEGYVWSYDNDDDTIPLREQIDELRDDPYLLPQLSVWTTLDHLKRFAFRSEHVAYYRRRHEWFVADLPKPYTVLYHVQAYHDSSLSSQDDGSLSPLQPPPALLLSQPPATPPPTTLADAFSRLRYLKEHGPTAHAFTFATATQFLTAVSADNVVAAP
jgi:hypothetical protein